MVRPESEPVISVAEAKLRLLASGSASGAGDRFRSHPLASVSTAFAAGLLLGRLALGGRGSPAVRPPVRAGALRSVVSAISPVILSLVVRSLNSTLTSSPERES